MTNNNNLWYRRTEAMLFAYPALDSAITNQEAVLRLMEVERMPSCTSAWGQIGPHTTADKLSQPEAYTDKRAVARDKIQAKLDKLRAQQVAVAGALAGLDDAGRALVDLWYFGNWRLTRKDKIWKHMGISSTTFWRRRNEVVRVMALWLGELVETGPEVAGGDGETVAVGGDGETVAVGGDGEKYVLGEWGELDG